jgi:hypothetical protein
MAVRAAGAGYTPRLVDAPVTPEEELLDALSRLEVGLGKIVEFLEVLLCEVIAAGGSATPPGGRRQRS